MKINVMIVDDQRLMREGLKTILDLDDEIQVAILAEDGQDALNQVKNTTIDVVLMDIRMPHMNGVQCTKIIKQLYPHIKILILTTFDDDEYIIEGIQNGADGYLLKDIPSEQLIKMINDLYLGHHIMDYKVAAKLVANIKKQSDTKIKHKLPDFTEREMDVLSLIGSGSTNKEIAEKLFISMGTAKNYISSIYDKLNIHDRSKVMLYAIEHHLID